jgi:hypothetical protein
MTACGFTPCQIDELTLHDVKALFTYWRENPPVHEILKCVYQIVPKTDTKKGIDPADPSGIGGLIARFPNGYVNAK